MDYQGTDWSDDNSQRRRRKYGSGEDVETPGFRKRPIWFPSNLPYIKLAANPHSTYLRIFRTLLLDATKRRHPVVLAQTFWSC